MAHTQSAEKRHRQDEKRRLRNRGRVRAIKKQIKSFEDLLKNGSTDDLKKAYNTAAKLLDKSAARRTIHPNMAARKKSQLAKKVAAKAAK